MGLFSSITGVVGDVIGSISGDIFGGDEAAETAREGAEIDARSLEESRDYLKGIDELPLSIRDEALPMLAGFYTGDQQPLIDDVASSPFYEFNLDQMEESVLRHSAMTGGFRSGDAQSALADNATDLLQGMTSDRLKGLSYLSTPQLNSNAIAGLNAQAGQAKAFGVTGAAQADLEARNQLLNLGTEFAKAKWGGGF